MKISACMIMKNEEKFLPQCLKSIKAYVDEIVIVDTGSTDRSMEIARSYGAKIYEHPWQDNFSLHRNQSISYATGDWLFFIDCDEELISKVSPKKFRRMLKEFGPEITHCVFTMQDINGDTVVLEWNVPKLFRRGTVQYQGIVHNQPIVQEAETVPLLSDFRIKHYGYALSQDAMAKKHERTKRLLLKRLADNPADYDAHFYLANTYAKGNDIKTAIEHATKYIEHKQDISTFNESIYASLLSMYMSEGRMEEARILFDVILPTMKTDVDVCMRYVELGQKLNRGDIILHGAQMFVQAYEAHEKNPAAKGHRFTFHHDISNLSYCYYQLVCNYLGHGMHYLEKFTNAMPKLPEKQAAALTNLMNQSLKNINITATATS